MKDFNFIRFIIGVVVLYVISMGFGYLIHETLLGSYYESIQGVFRLKPDMDEKMWMGFAILDVVYWVVFVFLFHFFSKGYSKSCWMSGACYGFLIGLLSIGMLWQYIMYPLPFSLVLKWFLFGLVVMIINGLVLSFIYKPKEVQE